MSKMDTQGMSPEMTPEERAEWEKSGKKQVHKPATIKPMRLITPMMVKELKILINEVLDERDGKRGISYFDMDHFKHYVGEEEPPYEDWV